ncbi:MAG: NADH-quinone oxidoreductase subunit NuoG [Desulfobacteraceae bacterium]|nr:NADH-quinone oxidoreductase subunit NuoG [Desulfobacteraceae bacterium]
MPTLTIDSRQISVPGNTKVIDAAERLGIMIPRFCYHPALGAVGACRVCAVNVKEGPMTGIQMSCMLDAGDGMVISTHDKDAVDFRMAVIEWLMMNHPHDCPVCDEGGHCLLQDMTVSGGHGMRRYPGPKRTHQDQYLGPLVQHEMNRCIQCYRCVRYYREYTGYKDLGVLGIGSRVYFGRTGDGRLESPFAGNLIDICPTGVFTDKPARFKGRKWDFERAATVCTHCSLGCSTITSSRYREIIRQEAGISPDTNDCFICDRGRYGFGYANLPDRPRQYRVNGNPCSRQTAWAKALDLLDTTANTNNPSTVALLVSARCTLETLVTAKHLCHRKGWHGPVWDAPSGNDIKSRNALDALAPELVATMKDVRESDFILAIGTDPVNEAPVLTLALRQAQRNGAHITVIDPRPVSLPFDFEHLPTSPEEMGDQLAAIVCAALGGTDLSHLSPAGKAFYDDLVLRNAAATVPDEIVVALKKSRHPVIVCGTHMVNEDLPVLAGECARMINQPERSAGLFYVLPGANGFGAAMFTETHTNAGLLLDKIKSNDIKTLIAIEPEGCAHVHSSPAMAGILKSLDCLLVMDYLESPLSRAADVFIPTATVFESGGIFINQNGTGRSMQPLYMGGTPIFQTGRTGPPPRLFESDIPGAEHVPAWLPLADWMGLSLSPDNSKRRLEILKYTIENEPWLSALPISGDTGETGIKLRIPNRRLNEFASLPHTRNNAGNSNSPEISLYTVEQTFGTELLSSGSPALDEVIPQIRAAMHPADAEFLNLADGENLTLVLDENHELPCNVKIETDMAQGFIFIPRRPDLPWPVPGFAPIPLHPDQIRREKGDLR